jgi:hypothetical protein
MARVPSTVKYSFFCDGSLRLTSNLRRSASCTTIQILKFVCVACKFRHVADKEEEESYSF